MTFPKMLNKKTNAIFHKLIKGLEEPGQHTCIYNDGPYMAVHVDFLRTIDSGAYAGSRVFSVAHNFEQQGDMCADPDMEFLVTATGAVLPMTFQQAIPPIYQQALEVDGDKLRFAAKTQASITRFANQWMMNIADQQDLPE